MFNRVGNAPRAQPARNGPRPENVGRNKLAQFRHRGSPFDVGLPELRKLVPAYGLRALTGSQDYSKRTRPNTLCHHPLLCTWGLLHVDRLCQQ